MSEAPEKQSQTSTNLDSDNLFESQHIRQLFNNKIFKYFSKDTSSKIALATAIITLGSFFIKTLDYLRLKGYLSVFSVSIEHINYSANQGFSEFLIQAIIFIGLMCATSLSYLIAEGLWFSHSLRKSTYTFIKTKFFAKVWNFIKDTIAYIPISAAVILIKGIINALLWLFAASAKTIASSGIVEWITVLIFLSIIELVIAIAMLVSSKWKRKAQKKEQQKTEAEKQLDATKEAIKKTFKPQRPAILDFVMSTVILSVFLYSTTAYFLGVWTAHQTKSFSIIDEKYAIVYQNNDYFWAVASTEKNDILTLDTANQKLITVSDVEIEQKAFDAVVIDYLD